MSLFNSKNFFIYNIIDIDIRRNKCRGMYMYAGLFCGSYAHALCKARRRRKAHQSGAQVAAAGHVHSNSLTMREHP